MDSEETTFDCCCDELNWDWQLTSIIKHTQEAEAEDSHSQGSVSEKNKINKDAILVRALLL